MRNFEVTLESPNGDVVTETPVVVARNQDAHAAVRVARGYNPGFSARTLEVRDLDSGKTVWRARGNDYRPTE